MDKHFTIEHPYQRITLDFTQMLRKQEQRILTEVEWTLLGAAERRVYTPGGAGTNGWTDVNIREDSQLLAECWDHAQQYVENDLENDDALSSAHAPRGARDSIIQHRTASRVAQAMALLAFGADILIKS